MCLLLMMVLCVVFLLGCNYDKLKFEIKIFFQLWVVEMFGVMNIKFLLMVYQYVKG